MNRYAIYCTEEQTKTALGLGAPITKERIGKCITERLARLGYLGEENEYDYLIPTAEEMIGWLEEQKAIHNIEITYYEDRYGKGWFYCIFNENRCNVAFNRDYPTRKEATIAAIDAALEYLIKERNK